MKTVEERAKEFCNKLPLVCSQYRKEIEEQLILDLKRQDKITRYACAENVAEYLSVFDDGTFDEVFFEEINSEIMNTKAV